MASVLQSGVSFLERSIAATPLRGLAPAGLAVRLKKVGKHYDGKNGPRLVLREVDLAIEPGQFVVIIGRSGSGKSTLLRLLAGLETPDGGEVQLGGQSPAQAAAGLRVMFQDGRLLPWRRVIDNVALGLSSADRPRAEAALRAVGLEDRALDWPRVLSGGQKQRVALARALAANPALVLLDEPLGALDALTRLDMQELIENIWRDSGFTAVLVTHDVAEAALLADRILLVEDGGIALDLRSICHARAVPALRSLKSNNWFWTAFCSADLAMPALPRPPGGGLAVLASVAYVAPCLALTSGLSMRR